VDASFHFVKTAGSSGQFVASYLLRQKILYTLYFILYTYLEGVMAIFLLLYIILCLMWLFWACTLTYLVFRYRYPDDVGPTVLLIFWAVSISILFISFMFILSADWTTVPTFVTNLKV
jgi:hypothetical protein